MRSGSRSGSPSLVPPFASWSNLPVCEYDDGLPALLDVPAGQNVLEPIALSGKPPEVKLEFLGCQPSLRHPRVGDQPPLAVDPEPDEHSGPVAKPGLNRRVLKGRNDPLPDDEPRKVVRVRLVFDGDPMPPAVG